MNDSDFKLPPRDSTRSSGTYSENLAVKYLSEKGFTIVKQNFKFGKAGEIDIIARDGEFLVFVEVKGRTNKDYGEPEESVDYRKQRSLRNAAGGYLYINQIENQPCRFDVVAIDYVKKPFEIRHYVNAF